MNTENTNQGIQGLQYSIRTMAQDLERAKKEGGAAVAAIKTPSAPPIPPPPAPKIKLPEATTPAPVAPTTPTMPAPTVPPVAPATPTPPPIIPPPSISPAPAPKAPSLSIPPIEPRRITTFEPSVPSPIPAIPKPPITPAPITPKIPSIAIPPIKPSFFASRGAKLLIIITAIFLILGGSAGFGYWWFSMRQVPAPAPIVEIPEEQETPIVPQEPSLPTGIITTDQDIIVESDSKTPSPEFVSPLANKISLAAANLNDDTLARVLIKYVSPAEISYLSLNDSLTILGITMPQALNQTFSEGELLAFKKNNEARYGFAASVADPTGAQNAIDGWVKTTTIFYDVNGLYIDKLPQRPVEIKFSDTTIGKFAIKYINLPDSSVTLSLALSQEDKLFIIATSQEMLTRAIGIKAAEITPMPLPSEQKTMPYSSGALLKASGDPKIYRIIDDKKLFIPTKSAFSGSGYKVADVVTVAADILKQFENIRYFKLQDEDKVYEVKYGAETRSTLNQSKCLVTDVSQITPSEIKIATDAEFAKYPLGKCE